MRVCILHDMTTASASRQGRTPAAAYRYFTQHPIASVRELARALGIESDPIITSEYRPDGPGQGWTRTGFRKRVTGAWLRKLRANEGVTHVRLTLGSATAEFSIRELLSKAGGRTDIWAWQLKDPRA